MTLMPSQQTVLDQLLDPKSDASKFSRKVDYLIIPIVVFAVLAAFHIHAMLLMGDWDFWVDWKDRQYWVAITPIMLMIIIAAIQGIFYHNFRLPIGATLCGVLLIIGEWANRWLGFHEWSHFPLAMVWPAAVIPSCILLDMILLLTGNWMITAIFGGLGFALLFPASNYYMLQAFNIPIKVQTDLLTVADYMGFTYTRTGTPEYLRLIERGTLRTFGGNSAPIAAFFAGFVCMIIYTIAWHAGNWISAMGWKDNVLKTYMGYRKVDRVRESDGLGGAV